MARHCCTEVVAGRSVMVHMHDNTYRLSTGTVAVEVADQQHQESLANVLAS
jgi:hypothetical protein